MEREKPQELVSGRVESANQKRKWKEKVENGNEVLDVVVRGFNCSFCMQLPERPVSAAAAVVDGGSGGSSGGSGGGWMDCVMKRLRLLGDVGAVLMRAYDGEEYKFHAF
ncbi:hypothetical protein LOK49_LG06G00805 [Camellia lanceoleosa]|uniref:Uncharacterized protein n=1 Tax=Camellia lanceoleosa TaxID=1840588 RepID=A0ACC0HFZ9_9ERIC|nr:hypothetical protein LOK49_LG06G00805 [Camellia lanceoleosa]